jgi:hypothetical protein
MHINPSPATKSDRTLEWLGAAGFLLFAAGQIFQAFVMHAGLPAPDDLAANIAFDLSPANQARLLILFAGFVLFPASYVAAFRRVRGNGWALVGLVWLLLFTAYELLNRGYEIGAVLTAERAWLAASDAALRARLVGVVTSYGELQPTATLLILLCYALGSAALGFAITQRDWPSRLARLGLVLNAIRATLRFGALVLGIGVLAPISEAIFFPVMIFQYAALGVWLVLPGKHQSAESAG